MYCIFNKWNTPITTKIAEALHWGMQRTMQYYGSQFQQLITAYNSLFYHISYLI